MSSTDVLENPRSAKRRRHFASSASRVWSLCCVFRDTGAWPPVVLAMELRSTRNLVDQLLLFTQREADHVHFGGGVLSHGAAVRGVVPSAKHVLNVDRDLDAALQYATMDRLQRVGVGAQYDGGLHHQRMI